MEDTQTEEVYEESSASTEWGLLDELRLMFYGLGLVALVMSLGLNMFITNQNEVLQKQLDRNNSQIAHIEQNRSGMQNLLQELAQQAPAHPEAEQILGRYGFRVDNRPAGSNP